ncbi:glycosyltransferase family 2 protein [Infirmifilum sp. SLHALR2]
MKRELFKASRGFDEECPFFYDDVDFALRARGRGAKIGVVLNTNVTHLGGTIIKKYRHEAKYITTSHLYFVSKYFGLCSAVLETFKFLSWFITSLFRGKVQQALDIFLGIELGLAKSLKTKLH